jgi:NAD(P)H dehydrogenase (quinone)
MYGHVEKLAKEIKKGADSVEGVEATLWQVGPLVSFHSVSFLP